MSAETSHSEGTDHQAVEHLALDCTAFEQLTLLYLEPSPQFRPRRLGASAPWMPRNSGLPTDGMWRLGVAQKEVSFSRQPDRCRLRGAP